MNIIECRKYCISKKEITKSISFLEHPNIPVFKDLVEMFKAIDTETFENYPIICDPANIVNQRDEYLALKEPSYFNKFH